MSSKELKNPAFLLTVATTLCVVAGSVAVVKHQAGQIDSKADKAVVTDALAGKADASTVAAQGERIARNETRIEQQDGRYRELLVEVKDRMARIETKIDQRKP